MDKSYKTGMEKETYIFSIKGILSIIRAVLLRGANLFTILEIRTKLNPDKVALICDNNKYTYRDLYLNSIKLAGVLRNKYKLQPGHKVAILCSNHAAFLFSLFGVSAVGTDIYLLNVETSERRFADIVRSGKFDFIIYDTSISHYIKSTGCENKSLSNEHIEQIAASSDKPDFEVGRIGRNRIVLLTSGTTGISVEAERRTKLFVYLKAFHSLVNKLCLIDRRSLYIATPAYHGFGLVTLLSAFALGKEVYLQSKFDAGEACKLISDYQIDAVTLVPTMLQRMLVRSTSSLQSLRCIISGGAALSPHIVVMVQDSLGDILFNLYGTSESSVSLIAKPQDLKYSPATIGRKLFGIGIRITDKEGKIVPKNVIGHIRIKSDWSVAPSQWIDTGDLGYIDEKGYYFLKGRNDDMIVSGGENVFPSELENLLLEHPLIEEAIVTGIPDEEFGQRLKAFIVPKSHSSLTEEDVKIWLSTRAARYQMPKAIEFLSEIPLNSTGKPDKRKLT